MKNSERLERLEANVNWLQQDVQRLLQRLETAISILVDPEVREAEVREREEEKEEYARVVERDKVDRETRTLEAKLERLPLEQAIAFLGNAGPLRTSDELAAANGLALQPTPAQEAFLENVVKKVTLYDYKRRNYIGTLFTPTYARKHRMLWDMPARPLEKLAQAEARLHDQRLARWAAMETIRRVIGDGAYIGHRTEALYACPHG